MYLLYYLIERINKGDILIFPDFEINETKSRNWGNCID